MQSWRRSASDLTRRGDSAGDGGSDDVTVHAEDLILASVDDHICEPADMFHAHVPDRYRDRMPRVVDEPDGSQQWFYGDIRGRNLGLNAVAGKPPEMFNVNPMRYEEMRPGCYDVHERVRDMSAGGQLAGLNFPNWPGFSGQVLNQGPDRDVNVIMIQAYNDWHVDEWCGAHPERFIPCGILPLWDAELAAAEVRRLAGKGRTVTRAGRATSSRPARGRATSSSSTCSCASSTTGSASSCSVTSTSTTCAGSRTSRTPTPPGRTRPNASSGCSRASTTTSS